MAKRSGGMDIFTDNSYELKKLDQDYQDKYNAFFNYLTNQEKDMYKINVYSSICLDDLKEANKRKRNPNEVVPSDFKKYLLTLKRGKRYKEKTKEIMNRDREKIVVANLWEVLGLFVAIVFFGEYLTEVYLVNFSIDLIVGVLGLVIGVRSLIIKKNIIKRYKLSNRYFVLDITTVILCVLMKFFFVNIGFDLTFPFLALNYFFSIRDIKKQFTTLLE